MSIHQQTFLISVLKISNINVQNATKLREIINAKIQTMKTFSD